MKKHRIKTGLLILPDWTVIDEITEWYMAKQLQDYTPDAVDVYLKEQIAEKDAAKSLLIEYMVLKIIIFCNVLGLMKS